MLQGVIDFWVLFVVGNLIEIFLKWKSELWFENTYILKNYDTIEKFAKAEHVSPCIWASHLPFMPPSLSFAISCLNPFLKYPW
jgi:hypothetical protein